MPHADAGHEDDTKKNGASSALRSSMARQMSDSSTSTF